MCQPTPTPAAPDAARILLNARTQALRLAADAAAARDRMAELEKRARGQAEALARAAAAVSPPADTEEA